MRGWKDNYERADDPVAAWRTNVRLEGQPFEGQPFTWTVTLYQLEPEVL